MNDRINEKRGLFVLDGIVGFLIATVVLVVVVLTLAYFSMSIQNENATKFYDIVDEESIEMFNSNSRNKHIVDVKVEE